MNFTVQILANYLKDFLQVSEFNDYCINGIQVEGKEKIHKLGFAVSASLETLKEAKKEKVDALIVHHGLFWDRDSHAICGSKKEKIKLLLENDISLLAYHLPLDAHQEVGNNWVAARELGFENLTVFDTVGVKGSFKEKSIENMIKTLENYYEHPAFFASGGKKTISSAAIISGGAHKSIYKAVKEGVDLFITGSFDEPLWHIAKEEKIHFVALGHSATERIGPRQLALHIEKKFAVETLFIDPYNPF